MPPDGKDINMSVVKFVYKPIFLAKTPRPESGKVMAEGLRLSQARARVITSQHLFQNCAEIFMHSFVALA